MTAAQQVTLRSALEAMGDTPEAVAATLRYYGIRGVRHDAARHPVVRYLRNLTAAAGREAPLLLAHGRAWHQRYVWAAREPGTVSLPWAVGHFAWAFDSGQYPELEEREVATR